MGKYGNYHKSFDSEKNGFQIKFTGRYVNTNLSYYTQEITYTCNSKYRCGYIHAYLNSAILILFSSTTGSNIPVEVHTVTKNYTKDDIFINETNTTTTQNIGRYTWTVANTKNANLNIDGTNYYLYRHLDKWEQSLNILSTMYFNNTATIQPFNMGLPSFFGTQWKEIEYQIEVIEGSDIFASYYTTQVLNIFGNGTLIQPTTATQLPLAESDHDTFIVAEDNHGISTTFNRSSSIYLNTTCILTHLGRGNNVYQQWDRELNFYVESLQDLFIWLLRDGTTGQLSSDFMVHFVGEVSTDLTSEHNTKLAMAWTQEASEEYPMSDTIINTFVSDSNDLTSLTPMDNFLLSEGKCEYLYLDLLKIADPTLWEQIIAKTQDILGAHGLYVWFSAINNDKETTHAYVEITPSGLGRYGLAEREEQPYCDIVVTTSEYNPNDPIPDKPPKDDDPTDDTPTTRKDPTINPHCLLTKTYPVTPSQLQILGTKIWTEGFIDTIFKLNQNPIENIISVKMLPFTLPFDTQTNIYLGNFDTEIRSKELASDYSYRQTLGSGYISGIYGNFLDIVSTKITIFLPFIGYKELDTSIIMHKTLKVEYVTDIVTGSVKAILYANDIPFTSFDGTIGIDIPITSNNRSQIEASYITGALGVVGGTLSGSPLAVVGSGLSMSQSQFHSETKGSSSPVNSFYETMMCFIIYDRPDYYVRNGYAHAKGFPCNTTVKLDSISGYTEISDIDLSDIPFTEEEKEEIRTLLASGVYL